jgi:hypothetical protein
MLGRRNKGADPSERDAGAPDETATVEWARPVDRGDAPPPVEEASVSDLEGRQTSSRPLYDQEAENPPEDSAITQSIEPSEPAKTHLEESAGPHLDHPPAVESTDLPVEVEADPHGPGVQAEETATEPSEPEVAEEQLVWFPKWPERLTIEVGEPSSAGHIDMALISKPEDRPDTIIDFGREGNLVVRAASVRGLSHRFKRITRQDHYAIRTDTSARYLVVACADGVSSAERSDRAARIAAERGAEIIARQLDGSEPGLLPWEDVIRQVAQLIVGDAKKQLAARSDGELEPDGAQIMGFSASTVQYAVIETETKEDGLQCVWSVGVGDTSAWTLDAGTWSALTPVKNAGAAVSTSMVTPLPHLPPSEDLVVRRASLPQGSALFLMTDGVGDPLGAGAGDVAEELARRWGTPPDPYSFAAQVDFSRRSYDDDRTVIGIWVMHP